MGELPSDLVLGGFWPVGSRQSDRFDGEGGDTQCVRPHVADSYGLAGSSGSGRCGGIFYVAGRDTTDEPMANLVGSLQLSPGKRPGPGDSNAKTVILLSFGL